MFCAVRTAFSHFFRAKPDDDGDGDSEQKKIGRPRPTRNGPVMLIATRATRRLGGGEMHRDLHRLGLFFHFRVGPRLAVRPSPGLGWASLRNVAFFGSAVVVRAGASASGVLLSDAERRTVYALSTPPGKAGVAVFRVSGPAAEDAWRRMVRVRRRGRGRSAAADAPRPWRFERCAVVDPDSGDVLDEGLAVFFKGMSTGVFFIFVTFTIRN